MNSLLSLKKKKKKEEQEETEGDVSLKIGKFNSGQKISPRLDSLC